jgi:riboflavin kinase / FMN adenylyltransferase
MKLIRGLQNLRSSQLGSVVTIGTYDGLHLGHLSLLRRLAEHGARMSRPTMMLTFEPMPREFFAPANPPPRLTSLRERCRLLQRMGLDSLCVLRFDERLRDMTGEAFAQLLARDMRAAVVVIGHDFKFGRGAEAAAAAMQAAGQRLGFEVDVVPPVQVDNVRVSSSGIRDALARGDFAQVERWLGRPYSMIGRVVQGERLGRTLGYPTANMRLGRLRSPVQGIFAVRVRGAGKLVGAASGGPRPAVGGVASLGTRPTVSGTVPLLETHLFDFTGDLYGREIEVEFVAKLRDEQRFESLEALVEQMQRDATEARSVLNI